MPVFGVSGMFLLWSAFDAASGSVTASPLTDFVFGVAAAYGFWRSFQLSRYHATAFQRIAILSKRD